MKKILIALLMLIFIVACGGGGGGGDGSGSDAVKKQSDYVFDDPNDPLCAEFGPRFTDFVISGIYQEDFDWHLKDNNLVKDDAGYTVRKSLVSYMRTDNIILDKKQEEDRQPGFYDGDLRIWGYNYSNYSEAVRKGNSKIYGNEDRFVIIGGFDNETMGYYASVSEKISRTPVIFDNTTIFDWQNFDATVGNFNKKNSVYIENIKSEDVLNKFIFDFQYSTNMDNTVKLGSCELKIYYLDIPSMGPTYHAVEFTPVLNNFSSKVDYIKSGSVAFDVEKRGNNLHMFYNGLEFGILDMNDSYDINYYPEDNNYELSGDVVCSDLEDNSIKYSYTRNAAGHISIFLYLS